MESDISGDEGSYGSYDNSSPGSYYSPQYPDYEDNLCESVDYGEKEDDPHVDRISTLPDTIVLDILSHLPTKDAVKTSTLSKKFESLWALTPTLHFSLDYDGTPSHFRSFASSVDRTLILHNPPFLKKFRLDIPSYQEDFQHHVGHWVLIVLHREVKEIYLDFYCAAYSNNYPYKLPFSLCNCSTLVKLSLSYCQFGDGDGDGKRGRRRAVSWNSIKFLSFGYMELSEELVSDILLGSPSLEVLELRGCTGYNRLDIPVPTVKRLRIYGYDGDYCDSSSTTQLEISAPKIRSLGIYGSFRRKFRLINVDSVEDVTLDFRLFDVAGVGGDDITNSLHEGYFYAEFLKELLLQIVHAPCLTLGSWCLQVLLVQEVIRMGAPALQAKCLTIETRFDKWDLPVIRNLLTNSIFLEKLVLNIRPRTTTQFSFSQKFIDSSSFEGENYWASQNLAFQCLENHLKMVKIAGFTGGSSQIEFIEFILKKSLVLEKLVIDVEKSEYLRQMKHLKVEELLESVQRLLILPRTSSNALVLFFW